MHDYNTFTWPWHSLQYNIIMITRLIIRDFQLIFQLYSAMHTLSCRINLSGQNLMCLRTCVWLTAMLMILWQLSHIKSSKMQLIIISYGLHKIKGPKLVWTGSLSPSWNLCLAHNIMSLYFNCGNCHGCILLLFLFWPLVAWVKRL